MKIGYNKPLYVLPFDHRHSYGEEVFGYKEPMTPEQIASVAASKAVIFRGYELALAAGVPKEHSGILVDEEFGAAILRRGLASGYITVMPTEKSGQHEFDFEFADFAKHLDAFNPTFAKVLVRYNPDDDPDLNRRQLERLKRVSDDCDQKSRYFMFELLVPALPPQLDSVGGDHSRFDLELRPALMERAITEIQLFGIEPDVWKIEGLDRREDCQRVVAAARQHGRHDVGCIVLGRGEDVEHVRRWLKTAASVHGFIGFAVGRSTFLEPIVALRAGKMSADEAAQEISRRYQEWIQDFEQGKGV